MCPSKLRTKRIFRIFHILKINRIMPFCNLFMERPSYFLTTNHSNTGAQDGEGAQCIATVTTGTITSGRLQKTSRTAAFLHVPERKIL